MLVFLVIALPVLATAAGDGFFTPHPATPSFGAGSSSDVAFGDIDGDGDLDAVVANELAQAETVWLNDGAGNFSPHPTTPSFGAGDSTDLALGDVDGDGDLDAVVANYDLAQAETVWLNDGVGSFSPHPATPSFGAGSSFELALGDLDGDGDLDAVVANVDAEPETVWLNDGNGNFTPHPTTPSFGPGHPSAGMDIGDLDGDGDLDAVVSNYFGQAETVWLNDGVGSFSPHPATPSFGAGNSSEVTLGDLDGDGDLDAVVANSEEPQTVWRNDGAGSFSAHPTTPSFGAGRISVAVALGDLDGDGDLDAVVANSSDQPETVWLNDGTGSFSSHPTMASFGAGFSADVALGDLDSDGDLDAVVANRSGAHEAETVWLNIALPQLSISDTSVTEGDAGTTVATFTITRSGDISRQSYVQWSTADGSAISPTDYIAVAAGTATIGPWETTTTVEVLVNGDSSIEANDGFTVNLTDPVDATIADGTGVGRIINDDDAAFSIDDVTVTEGNAGTTLATFTVWRTGATDNAATVQWRTLDVHASAGSDYVPVPLTTLSFDPGEFGKTVSVTVNGDTAVEPTEDFYVRLTSPTDGHTIADATGLGIITNDDSRTNSLSIGDASAAEGDSGSSAATFTVSRAGDTSMAASVQWFTVAGTATAGEDFVAVSPTTLSFAAGETSKPVSITVNGDTVVEANETFYLRLRSPVGATIADGSGLGRITNDDVATFSVNDVTLTEGNAGTKSFAFTVTRTGATGGTATVQWSTADGTATAASGDYVAVAATTLTFGPGETTRSAEVMVKGDTTTEANETFLVKLTSPVGAAMGDTSGLGRITNDD